jgi:hypothetical protein
MMFRDACIAGYIQRVLLLHYATFLQNGSEKGRGQVHIRNENDPMPGFPKALEVGYRRGDRIDAFALQIEFRPDQIGRVER